MEKTILNRSIALTAALILMTSAFARAQTPGDADYPQPSPSARHNEKVAAVKSGSYDLVLIGDSITGTFESDVVEWEPLKAVWNKHFAPRHALNLGYGGYRTEHILWNLQNGELDFAHPPKVITLLIGTNNTDDQHYPQVHTAEQVFAGTKAIVELIRKRLPTTKIIVLRIFPCGGPGDQTPYQRKYNRSAKALESVRRAGELTAQLADDKQVFWLDVNHVFLRSDGTIDPALMPDLIHPNAAGAEAWAQAIEPTLAQLMGDKPIIDAVTNPAVVPVSQTNGIYDWMARHNAALAAKATNPQVVFIGDSITHLLGGIPTLSLNGNFDYHVGDNFWASLKKDLPVLNLGFGIDATQNVLWRLDHGELDGLSPRYVVLMIGTNNVLHGNRKVDEIIAGVRACLVRIRAKVPHTKIILMGVLPIGGRATEGWRPVVTQVNVGLAALAKEAKVDYLDLAGQFLDAQGDMHPGLTSDGIHPTAAGYQIWANALCAFDGLAYVTPELAAGTWVKAADVRMLNGPSLDEKHENISFCNGGGNFRFGPYKLTPGTIKGMEVIVGSYGGGKMHVRLDAMDGPTIGTLVFQNTGGWSTFKSQGIAVKDPRGDHRLYFVFEGGAGICNFKQFRFTTEQPK